jgi:hypothetical protein
MKNIKIQVSNKIASLVNDDEFLVCGNSDYTVTFEFDEGWENYVVKTALFVFGNEAVAKVFEGDTCEGVAIEGATKCGIGCFAGDLRTTTPAFVNCLASVRDLGGVPNDPEPEVYDQIVELLNRYINSVKGAPAGGKTGQVLKKKSDLDYDYEWQDDKMRDLTDYYTKKEVDDKKVEKLSSDARGSLAYVQTPSGHTNGVLTTQSTTPNSLVIRNANGQSEIETPTEKKHIANKEYVDGVIPVFSTSEIENGHRVSITQGGETTQIDVLNGEKGDKGDPYVLTEADIATITENVLKYLPNGDEVAY